MDDRFLTLECLAAWLQTKNSRFAVSTHRSVSEVLDKADGLRPGMNVIVLSIGGASPGSPDVENDLQALHEQIGDVPVLLLSDREDNDAVVEALERGAKGYIPTSISASVLVGAIHLVQLGGTFVPSSVLANMHRATPPPSGESPNEVLREFTPRQMQVLERLRQGLSNKVIAYELDMCESTVKVHIRHIMKKLKATNRTQVAYMTNGLFGGAPLSSGRDELS